jgi:hypothetical protein
MADDGTLDGTLVEATIASPFEIETTYVYGNDETTLCGTMTGDGNPVDGIETDDGMLTYATADEATTWMTDDGT